MKALLQRKKIGLNYIFTYSIKFQCHGKITNFIHRFQIDSREIKFGKLISPARVPNPHKLISPARVLGLVWQVTLQNRVVSC
jgi:hypothetical protein